MNLIRNRRMKKRDRSATVEKVSVGSQVKMAMRKEKRDIYAFELMEANIAPHVQNSSAATGNRKMSGSFDQFMNPNTQTSNHNAQIIKSANQSIAGEVPIADGAAVEGESTMTDYVEQERKKIQLLQQNLAVEKDYNRELQN